MSSISEIAGGITEGNVSLLIKHCGRLTAPEMAVTNGKTQVVCLDEDGERQTFTSANREVWPSNQYSIICNGENCLYFSASKSVTKPTRG